MGTIPGHPPEPVAWINLKGNARIFYTSLGHPGDFDNPSFRRLLRNAVLWALDKKATSKPGPRADCEVADDPERPWPARRLPRPSPASASPTTSSSSSSWPNRSCGSRCR